MIIGGGGARRTPALAARYADEFNAAFRTVEDTAAAFGRVRAACAEAGRDPASMTYSAAHVTVCAKDEAELARRAAAIGRDLSELRSTGLVGTPSEVVDKIGAYAEAGATTRLPADPRPGRPRPPGPPRLPGPAPGLTGFSRF